jgi:hypothetical protein
MTSALKIQFSRILLNLTLSALLFFVNCPIKLPSCVSTHPWSVSLLVFLPCQCQRQCPGHCVRCLLSIVHCPFSHIVCLVPCPPCPLSPVPFPLSFVPCPFSLVFCPLPNVHERILLWSLFRPPFHRPNKWKLLFESNLPSSVNRN